MAQDSGYRQAMALLLVIVLALTGWLIVRHIGSEGEPATPEAVPAAAPEPTPEPASVAAAEPASVPVPEHEHDSRYVTSLAAPRSPTCTTARRCPPAPLGAA